MKGLGTSTSSKFFDILERIIISILIILLPVFFLNLFVDTFLLPKTILLTYIVLFLVFLKSVRVIFEGGFEIKFSKHDFPLLFLFIILLVSSFLSPLNRVDSFFYPGTATYTVSCILLYFLLNQSKDKKTYSFAVFFSGLVLSLFTLFSQIGLFSRLTFIPYYLKNPLFSPTGGLLPTFIYLLAILPLGLGLIFKQKDNFKKVFLSMASLIILLGAVFSFINILPGKPASPILPDFETSWKVAINTIREKPFLGIGPGNYLTAFTKFRPVSYNLSDNWAVKFTTSRNWYLTTITETGILGLVGIILLLNSVIKDYLISVKTKEIPWKKISLILLLVLLLFFPGSLSLIFLLAILLSLSSISQKKRIIKLAVDANNMFFSRLPAIILTVPVLALIVFFFVKSFSVLRSEKTVGDAIKAVSQNDGVSAYNFLRKAISEHPKVDRYHVSYSQINLAIARNLALQQNLTDEDRNTLTILIQQAIVEAKTAVSLNPQKASLWENLGRVYRSILSFAKGADQFALQSFKQAVALDPVNPNLRICLGGVYYALGDYDNAIKAFELAVLAKPDLANAHYNLAIALREKGETEKAIEQMSLVLSLVSKDSKDYEVAKTELEKLESRIVKGTPDETENLVPPKETEQIVKPPIELPKDSNPPENAIEKTE